MKKACAVVILALTVLTGCGQKELPPMSVITVPSAVESVESEVVSAAAVLEMSPYKTRAELW